MIALLLPLLIMSDPVPIAGRPADFSGAVGGPFVVTMSVDKTVFPQEHSARLTVTIKGPGDLSKIVLPDLNKDQVWRERFQIDVRPTNNRSIDPQARTFAFDLRAKRPGHQQIPPLKFTYFSPAIRPPSKGWQTTYAEPINIFVEFPVVVGLEVGTKFKDWQLRFVNTFDDSFQMPSWLAWMAYKLKLTRFVISDAKRLRRINEIRISLGQHQLSNKSLPTFLASLLRLSREWPDNKLLNEGLAVTRELVKYPTDQKLANQIKPEAQYFPRVLFQPELSWLSIGALAMWAMFFLRTLWRLVLSWRNPTIALITSLSGAKPLTSAPPSSRRWIHFLKLVILFVMLVLAILPLANLAVIHLRLREDKVRQPIVVTTDTELRIGNGLDYEVKQSLPHGVEARLVSRRGNWAQIEFASGLTGWVPNNAVWPVFPEFYAP